MASRYDNTPVFVNNDELYDEFFEERNVNFIRQYRSGRLRHPTLTERASLERVRHVWKIGDRLYKLAHQYYGDSRLWWVIAWYNKKPTEGHFKIGDLIRIPMPLNQVLSMLRRL
jgi:nucleoid-associated protein YgaU